ncbi:MAG: NUDIX hydrolase [Phycisphaerales bacterium]|nr:NUDIX hydrolase [Phycisphaerae bacterium]NNF44640.1 NUDIX hydrolase [Phycisphaerales bacterium]NNM27260.1 NUDIX hydrolase [Phycisphaerales bacterium]
MQSEMVYEGRRISVEVLSPATGDDATRREVVRHPGAVAIVPVTDAGAIVLIRNHRVAVDRTLWELPAGTLEPGEPPEVAATRELEEETGYRPTRVRRLAGFYASPGFLDERITLFVADGLVHVGQRLEPGERIEPVSVSLAETLAMIDDGRIEDGKTIAGILLFDRARRVTPP